MNMLSFRNHGMCRRFFMLHGKNLTYCHRRNIHHILKTLSKGDYFFHAKSINVCPAIVQSSASYTMESRVLSTSVVSDDDDTNANKGIADEIIDEQRHVPVMVTEVLDRLNPENGQLYIDMTFGGGGHTRAILDRAPDARVVCLDRDPVAHQIAVTLSQKYSPGQILPCLGQFSEISSFLDENSIKPNTVDGVLFDVGLSSMQFDTAERGFSISKDGPLDMRMDAQRMKNHPNAADVVNKLDEIDLYHIIKKYGEEKAARKIPHAIIQARSAFGDITRTTQLAEIVATVFTEGAHRKDKMKRHSHVATKTFQAIRIFVNNELNELHNGLEIAHNYLSPGGVCVALTFHSLEDRIVKRHFHGIDMDEKPNASVADRYRNRNSAALFDLEEVKQVSAKKWAPIGKKVTITTEVECLKNPRARSAKLRAAIKSGS